MAEETTIEELAKDIVGYLINQGLNLDEAQTQIATAIAIMLKSAGITLAVLNEQLKNRNEGFVEFDNDTFSALLSYLAVRTNIKVRFGFLQ